MFYLSYLLAELRRRKSRTLLTALGLGVGVGLVVTVAALSDGLDRAQAKVLEPLTGVGTDMTVTRALEISGGDGGFRNLSAEERARLQEENGAARIRLDNLGDPGDKFTTTQFMSGAQLSFSAAEVSRVAALGGIAEAAGGLTVNAATISGEVPERLPGEGQVRGAPGPGPSGGPPENIDFDSFSITGIDAGNEELGAVSRSQLTAGEWLGGARDVLLNDAYGKRNDLGVGDQLKVGKRSYTVVGLVGSPLGGTASDVYMQLGELQAISDRKGRVNAIYARATDGDDVAALASKIEGGFADASVTTAQDLADRVGGSLVDAKNLSGKLGTALTIVALAAALLIAMLLTLGSIAKRVRELGTLKAIGWPQRLVVRQVTMESVATGALGGILGAAIGVGGAELISAIGPTLEASVAAAAPRGPGFAGPGGPGPGGGSSGVTSGTQLVGLDAPVDVSLIALAVGLALLGGLLAGVTGALRAARLRPADALRNLD